MNDEQLTDRRVLRVGLPRLLFFVGLRATFSDGRYGVFRGSGVLSRTAATFLRWSGDVSRCREMISGIQGGKSLTL